MSDFDRETAVEKMVGVDGQSKWSTHLTSNWSIEGNPNGGYALVSSLRALAAEIEHPDPIAVTTNYLRPAVGSQDGTIEVDVVRQGRRTSTVRSGLWQLDKGLDAGVQPDGHAPELSQPGKQRLATLATFGDLEQFGASPRLPIDAPDLPPPEECLDRSQLPQGVSLPLLSRVDVRIDPRRGMPNGGDPVMAGWIRFADKVEPDIFALPLFADAFPPSVFGVVGVTGWVPTIELTVHVRARPAPGWIKAQFVTTDMANGLLVEDGLLWDSSGTLVAQCRQLAVLMH